MIKKITFSIILIIFSFSSIYSQEVWTLEKCIEYALENNLQIKVKELSVQQKENTLQQSKMNFIPSLNASLGHNMNWGKSVNINDLKIIENKLSQSTSASLSSSITLLDGLSKIKTLKKGKTDLKSSIQDVEQSKNEITLAITRAYLQVLFSKQLLETTKSSFESISQQKERTKKLVDAGSQAYSTLLDIESQLATERVQVVSAQNELSSNILTLMQLLDMQYNPAFDIATPEVEYLMGAFANSNIDSLYRISMSLPQIKKAELELEMSKYDLSIAKGKVYPRISLSAGYGTYYSDTGKDKFMDQFNENRNPSIGLNLSIPIFNNLQVRTGIKNAELNVKNSEISLRSSHQTLYKEVQKAINDADSYYQKYLATQLNLKAMEESFFYVEQKFNVGTVTSTDYIVSKNNLFKSRSDFYQAKYQFIFQLKIIDFYKGIPIKL